MTANIIPFPRKAVAPLPGRWSDADMGHFLHMTHDGSHTREDAVAGVEAIRRLRAAWPSIRGKAVRAVEQVKRLSP